MVLFWETKSSDVSPSKLNILLGLGGKVFPGDVLWSIFPLGLSLPQYMCPSIPLVFCSPFIRNYQVRLINVEQTLKATQDFVFVSIFWFLSFPIPPRHEIVCVLYDLQFGPKPLTQAIASGKNIYCFIFVKSFNQLSRFYCHFWRHLAFWQQAVHSESRAMGITWPQLPFRVTGDF